jgi:hypothetical protein
MRRILALAAVSGLALTGLASTPAAADSTIQVEPDIVINEVGFDLTEGFQDNINFVELHNTTLMTGFDIDGWQIKSCAANGNVLGTTVIGAQMSDPTTIDDFRLAGDSNYAASNFPARDYDLDGTNGNGLDTGGGVALLDDLGTAVHSVVFTSNPSGSLETCLQVGDFEPEVSPSPAEPDESAQRVSGSWGLDDVNPQSGQ